MHEFQEIHKEHKDLLTEQLKAKDEMRAELGFQQIQQEEINIENADTN